MLATKSEGVGAALLRTPRLVLAPLAPNYADALFELLNDWEVARMLSEVPWPLRHDDVADFLAAEHPSTDDYVLVGESGPIGVASVKKRGSGEPPRLMPRLGYWIGKRHWARGYATEAVSALVEYAFHAHADDRISAGIFHDNPASRRVLEKLGFAAMGCSESHSRSRGGMVETVDMQLTRTAWSEGRPRR